MVIVSGERNGILVVMLKGGGQKTTMRGIGTGTHREIAHEVVAIPTEIGRGREGESSTINGIAQESVTDGTDETIHDTGNRLYEL